MFVGVWITDFLIHGVWLQSTYKETMSLWRPEAEMRLRSQRSVEEFRSAADVVIENDADRERTKERVRAAWMRAPTTGRGSSPGP